MSSDLAHLYSRTRNARKVIVVDLGFLGDTVHLVPPLWELKRNYAGAELHVLTSTVGQEVLRLAPCVDRVWGLEMFRETRTLRQQWSVLRALRRERFDVAFNFSGADRTNFMTALTGARWRVAHRGGRWHFYNSWVIRDWIPRQDPNQLVSEQRRQMLVACGLSLEPARFDLRIDNASDRWAAGIVRGPTVHVSPNSNKAVKEWPLDHYISLVNSILAIEPPLNIVISGTARERERARLDGLAAKLKSDRIHFLAGGVSISQLAALLARCLLHIGSDSGVLHLAFALQLPTISFLREQPNFGAFMPTGPTHRVFAVPCGCLDGPHAPCEKLQRAECLAQIQPDKVVEAVREQVGAAKTRVWPRANSPHPGPLPRGEGE